jgi:hypothetical protein
MASGGRQYGRAWLMVTRAAVPVPPRITEDVVKGDSRNLRLFLENVRERLKTLESSTGESTTIVSGGGGSLTNADTLDGYDSSAFARKAANETITGTWTHNASVTATQFIETSDKRLKRNIKPLRRAAEMLCRLVGVSYIRRDTKEHEIGFIAQDVQEIFPELVSEQGEYLGVNYSRVVAILVEGFKEQQERIKDLELQVESLKRTID